MWCASSLPLISGPLRPRVVVPVSILCRGKIDEFSHLLWIIIAIRLLKPYSYVPIVWFDFNLRGLSKVRHIHIKEHQQYYLTYSSELRVCNTFLKVI